MENDGSFVSYGVDISGDSISVNYLIKEYLVWVLKVAGVDTGNIFRWRTMAASFPMLRC